jgi:Mitochondrial ATPase inhibitor, IATP
VGLMLLVVDWENVKLTASFLYSDAFTKREKANEDYYVRQQEKQKLV